MIIRDEKPFQCNHCDEEFASLQTLGDHECVPIEVKSHLSAQSSSLALTFYCFFITVNNPLISVHFHFLDEVNILLLLLLLSTLLLAYSTFLSMPIIWQKTHNL